MASRIIAFITEDPNPDVRELYCEYVVSEQDQDEDEVCLAFDLDEYELSGFAKKDLIIDILPPLGGSKVSWLARRFPLKTGSIPVEKAIGSTYCPDLVVFPDGENTEWPDDNSDFYEDIAQDYPRYFITICYNHF